MEPDSGIRTKYCKNCKSRINMVHFDIHAARCLPPLKPPSARKQRQEHKSKHIPFGEAIRQDKQQILCSACGIIYTSADRKAHLFTCPKAETECNFCSAPFPACIINEHTAICHQNPHNSCILPKVQINVNKSSTEIQSANICRANLFSPNIFQSIPMPDSNPNSLQQRSHIFENSNIFNTRAQNVPNIFHSRPLIPSQQNKNQLCSQIKHKLYQNIGRQDTQNLNSSLDMSNFRPSSDLQRNQIMDLSSNIDQSSFTITEFTDQRLLDTGSENHTEQNIPTNNNSQNHPEQGTRTVIDLQNQSISQFGIRLRQTLLITLQENHHRLEQNTDQIKSLQEQIEKCSKRLFQIRKQRERLIVQLHQMNHKIKTNQRSEQIEQQKVQKQIVTNQIQVFTRLITQIIQCDRYLVRKLEKSKRQKQQIEQQQKQIQQSIEEIARFAQRLMTILQLAYRHNDYNTNGLTQAQIENIKDKQYVNNTIGEPQKCAICFCQIQQNQFIKDIPCKHIYHTQCISKWLKVNAKCPLCKRNIATIAREESEDMRPVFRPLVITLRVNEFYYNDDSDEQQESSIFQRSFQQQ